MSETMSSQQRIGALDARGWTSEAGARLKAAVRAAKWQQEKLADAAGIARSTLMAIFKGKHTPREATLEAICNVIGVDVDQIIGDGEIAEAKFGPADQSLPMSGDVQIKGDDYNVIRHHAVNVSAGAGLLPVEDGPLAGIAFPRSWLIKRGIAADLAGLVTVKGDSMAPTIPDGSTVLVQIAEPYILREAIYVFSRSGEAFVKRILPVAFADDGRATSIVIISDNQDYPPEVIVGKDLNGLRIIGKVKAVMADL